MFDIDLKLCLQVFITLVVGVHTLNKMLWETYRTYEIQRTRKGLLKLSWNIATMEQLVRSIQFNINNNITDSYKYLIPVIKVANNFNFFKVIVSMSMSLQGNVLDYDKKQEIGMTIERERPIKLDIKVRNKIIEEYDDEAHLFNDLIKFDNEYVESMHYSYSTSSMSYNNESITYGAMCDSTYSVMCDIQQNSENIRHPELEDVKVYHNVIDNDLSELYNTTEFTVSYNDFIILATESGDLKVYYVNRWRMDKIYDKSCGSIPFDIMNDLYSG